MTDSASPSVPSLNLEERFLMPKGWRWHSFKNPQGRAIRFGTVAPPSGIPDAIVVGLQGLGEFTEKYFETARTLVAGNLSFWMMDWQGQGLSQRHLKDPHKRHSSSFDEDIADFHYFVMEYIKHAAVHPDVGRIPLVMLGHSMGANIGLHYLRQHPDIFAAAAFSAPMIGINAFKNMPNWLTLMITGALKEAMNQAYVEFGGGKWNPATRAGKRGDIHTSDPVRKEIHNAWCLHDPRLQVGNVTYGWLHEAQRSCARLQKKGGLDAVRIPCLFALAGHETLVDNKAAQKAISRMPHAETIHFPEAKHEILMECDGIRAAFFEALMALLEKNRIKEKLKPF